MNRFYKHDATYGEDSRDDRDMVLKYSAGPWKFEYGAAYSIDKGRLILADRDNPVTAPTERDANVRLCAAVPDLLEALQAILNGSPDYCPPDEVWVMAEKAVAKALGKD